MNYNAHGILTAIWQENILIVTVQGPVNAEGAKQFNAQIRTAVDEKCVSSWVRIEDFSGEEHMGTPETFGFLRESLRFSLNNGCLAIVLCNASLLIKEKFCEACTVSNINCLQADDMNNAVELAKQILRDSNTPWASPFA